MYLNIFPKSVVKIVCTFPEGFLELIQCFPQNFNESLKNFFERIRLAVVTSLLKSLSQKCLLHSRQSETLVLSGILHASSHCLFRAILFFGNLI